MKINFKIHTIFSKKKLYVGGHDKEKEGHGHKKEHVPEYSSDKDHVNHIASNTLFYKDTKNIKFQQKPDGHSHDREVSIDAGKFDFVQVRIKPTNASNHFAPTHADMERRVLLFVISHAESKTFSNFPCHLFRSF